MAEKIIVFDFDKTLYKKDSLIAFHFFMMRRNPLVALWLPVQAAAAVLYKLRFFGTHRFKSIYLFFLAFFSEDAITRLAKQFWATEFPRSFNAELMQIMEQQHSDIVIVTASPEIYIRPLSDTFGIKKLIGTRLRKKGKFYLIDGHNCKGDQKVKRLQAEFGKDVQVTAAYTDDLSDTPLLKIAEHPYLMENDKIIGFT